MKKNFCRFVIKSLVFIGLCIFFDWIVGMVFRGLENYAEKRNPENMVAEYTMWDVNSEVVIIGASEAQHSYVSSIIADSLDMSVYNCGEDGQFFYYQNAMVNGVLDRYKPKAIIWSINPSYLSHNELAKERISALKPFCRENSYCKDMLQLKSKYEKIKTLSSCYVYNSQLVSYILCSIKDLGNHDLAGYVPIQTNKTIDGPKFLDYIANVDDEVVNIFNNTLKRAKENQINIVFVFTPAFTIDDYSKIDSYLKLKAVLNQYQYTLIEEFYHDKTLMQKEYFKDKDHLNHTGARIFTSMLAHRIKSLINNS